MRPGVWEAVSTLLGGRHSRGCRACGRSFCTTCKHTHMRKAPLPKGSSAGFGGSYVCLERGKP